jgi:hypothetical protein
LAKSSGRDVGGSVVSRLAARKPESLTRKICKDGKEIPVGLLTHPAVTETDQVRRFGGFITDGSAEASAGDRNSGFNFHISPTFHCGRIAGEI